MELIERARRWISQDPDADHRQEIEQLIDNGDTPGLTELFTGRLAFGTAGLRARLGPGPNRMNSLVVQQTTLGLLRWMQRQGTVRPKIVIGFDARHRSREFARSAADVIGGSGGEAIICDDVVPTPVLALAILTYEADAGVMITASHNPPDDNGYKLYLGDGIQIIPPTDDEIAAAIDEIAAGAEAATFGAAADVDVVPARRWIDAHRRVAVDLIPGSDRDVQVVYTPMHGVGGAPFLAAALDAGFPRPHVVFRQFDPDPDFSTVSFPNPEEEGALDLALEMAVAENADAVVAHDPDADRLALAVPGRDGDAWTPLSGDQVGLLLADHLIRAHTAAGGGDAVVAKSLVSSQAMEALAAAAGVRCRTTPTGFKWVARPIVDEPDAAYLLGYEEALGYCVGGAVRDKDGISAALVAMQMLASIKASGRTVWTVLDVLDQRFGAYRTHSFSHRLSDAGPGPDEILAMVLDDPPSGPAEITEVTDLSRGVTMPPTPGVLIRYADRSRIIVRPSGTEPKVKFYLEAVGTPEEAETRLRLMSAALAERLSRLPG
jgi:phosphomannomutase